MWYGDQAPQTGTETEMGPFVVFILGLPSCPHISKFL
jgi:hypothetical protein